MYHNEFLIRADEFSIVLRHPIIAGTVFTFRADGFYEYHYDCGADINARAAQPWKLDHDKRMLIFEYCGRWIEFWHKDEINGRQFYLALLEWQEIDNILLSAVSETNNIQQREE